jgi:hypothetical protein
MAAWHQRQVVAHEVGSYGCTHKKHPEPETPITMGASPVRRNALMNMFTIHNFMRLKVVLALMHWFSSFSTPSRTIPG